MFLTTWWGDIISNIYCCFSFSLTSCFRGRNRLKMHSNLDDCKIFDVFPHQVTQPSLVYKSTGFRANWDVCYMCDIG